MLDPGTKVRLIADPGRVGVITGQNRERANRRLLEVVFPDGTHFIPEDQLEVVEEVTDPIKLLEAGRFGRASDLRQNLTYIRLSGRLANLIYSMDTTNTDFYPYQFKPVLNFLNSPGKGILLADEVGLGKTIEAGLIWTELRSRFDTRRLLVLCKAMLRDKWKDELYQKFGIRAEILQAKDVLEKMQISYQEGGYAEFAIIGSFEGLRPNRDWDAEDVGENQGFSSKLARFLESHSEEEPLIDLLIIDEAHYLRNPETMTAKMGRLLKQIADHIILLSATPIHLKNTDLYYLLNLVDEDTFDRTAVFDAILEANGPLVNARDALVKPTVKSEDIIKLLQDAQSHPLLQGNRQLKSLISEPPTDEQLKDKNYLSKLNNRLESINLLSGVVTRTRKREVREWRVIREAIPEEIPLTPPEAAFYEAVTELVREFCLKYDQHEGFLLVMPQRQIASSMAAALRSWQRREVEFQEQIYEDTGAEDNNVEVPGPLVQELLSKAYELADLNELWANDSKFIRLVDILKDVLSENPDEKIVLFSYFRPTLDYLDERLHEEGIKCIVLKGGAGLNKTEILAKFKSPDGPNVLLSSEVGSEGIDLQFSRMIINYDLPWNPMKVEQRIGRIDRIGQKSDKILIWNIFCENTIDARIYHRLYHRLRIFERALGGLEVVLGEAIRKLTLELLSWKLSPEQEAERIEQTALAIENNRQAEERLEDEASNLIAHGDYILNQIKASRELNRLITGNDLWIYTRDFFGKNYANCGFRQIENNSLLFDVSLSNEAKFDLDTFIRQNKLSALTRLARTTPQPIRCLFENRVSAETPGRVEIISQFHPLIRFITSKLKSLNESFYPTVSIRVKHSDLPQLTKGVYIFSVTKWSIKGIQDQEKLYFTAAIYPSGTYLESEDDAERLVLVAAISGEDWPEAHNQIDLKETIKIAKNCLDHSFDEYEKYIQQISAENNDRADFLEKTLDNHLKNQLEKLNEISEKHKLRGRDSLVKATKGRIKALQDKVARKRLQIQDNRMIKNDFMEVSVGVIKLGND